MQVLIFHIGVDRYALRTAQIACVLPLLDVKKIPGAPPYVAGLMHYRGTAIPVLDLSRLGGGAASKARFETRIIMVDYPARDGSVRALGLIAEQVTGTQMVDPTQVVTTGINNPAAACLGEVVGCAEGLLQLVTVELLLSAEARDLLFPDAVSTT